MPSSIKRFLACAAILLGIVSPVSAAIQVGDMVTLRDGVGAPGGIFKLDDLNDPNPISQNYDFLTYCVEVSEFIGFSPNQYKVGSVGTVTKASGKTITDYTAWLYTSFLDNTFYGTSFNANNMADANALQLAIWMSVGWGLTGTGPTIDDYISSSWITTTYNHLTSKPWKPGGTGTGSFAASGWTPGNLNGVQVMNLYGGASFTQNAQDQLFRIPPTTGTPPAPEAASVMIWGLLAFCATFAAGRRRND